MVIVDLALRKTRWGRHVFAVGGNEEAARRSGIKVNRIYFSVFALTSVFAAVGGLLAAGQLTSVSQSSGTTDTNLTAIAAAVIGGTSLFGGRGSAYAAMLGIVVLQAIQSGLNIIGVDSSVRFMVTGAVLLLAVAIDSVSSGALRERSRLTLDDLGGHPCRSSAGGLRRVHPRARLRGWRRSGSSSSAAPASSARPAPGPRSSRESTSPS